jgi:hypothetical protein
VQRVSIVVSVIGLAFALAVFIWPNDLGPIGWALWVIVPPIWFIIEYEAAYHGWLGEAARAPSVLEHHRHLQSLFAALWVAIAAILYWRIFENGGFV